MNKQLFLLLLVMLFAGCGGRGHRHVKVHCEKRPLDLDAYMLAFDGINPAWTVGKPQSTAAYHSSFTPGQASSGDRSWIERIGPTCSTSDALVAEAIESVRAHQPSRRIADRSARSNPVITVPAQLPVTVHEVIRASSYAVPEKPPVMMMVPVEAEVTLTAESEKKQGEPDPTVWSVTSIRSENKPREVDLEAVMAYRRTRGNANRSPRSDPVTAAPAQLPVTVPKVTRAPTFVVHEKQPATIVPAEPEVAVTPESMGKQEEPATTAVAVTSKKPEKKPREVDSEVLRLRQMFEETRTAILAISGPLDTE